MRSGEEYEIIKERLAGNLPPIKMDGKYFVTLKERLIKKFSSSPNPELRVQRLEENAKQIYRKIQLLENLQHEDRNLLLVGKVQSGKTSNMQMAVALAFDNGYDALVLYGGYDNTLLDQAITRFTGEAFKKPDSMSDDEALTSWMATFTTLAGKGLPIEAVDDEIVEEIQECGGKILFICRKGPDAINKINAALEKLDRSNLKALIFDDEGDQASLNNEFRKDGQSPTYHSIVVMKGLLSNPPYLSVTATPQALVFSPETSRLRPRDLQLIHPGEGYTGLDRFHLDNSRVIDVEDEMDDYLSMPRPQLPQSLWKAIYAYVVTSALLKHQGILSKTQMIVHFDKLKAKHAQVFDLVTNQFESFRNAIKNSKAAFIEKKLMPLRQVFDDDSVISPEMRCGLSFEDIYEDLVYVFKKVHVALMNSSGKDTMAGLPFKKYQIRIGADLLQRGVSFDQLVTTYFTRWPKGASNMDTQIQRARWLGYRTSFYNFCHVYTTSAIDYRFSRLAEIEDDLWSQMAEVEAGVKTLGEIIVDADPKMRPSRKSASDYRVQIFGRKWINQSIATSVENITNSNNQAAIRLFSKYRFVPIHAGATPLDPDRITGFKARISFEDFKEFVDATHDLFDNKPFGGPENLLKAVYGKSIDVILFWNPEAAFVDYETMSFGSDIRTRKFHDIDDGCRISALQQGADSTDEAKRKYLGDAHVVEDEQAVTIQISPIMPKPDESPARLVGQTQFMYSIRMPKAIAVYTKGDDL